MNTGKKTPEDRFANAEKKTLWRRFLLLAFIAGSVFFAAWLAFSLVSSSLGKLNNSAKQSTARKQMYRIGIALMMYAARNEKQFPDKLSVLYKESSLDLAAFDSPELPGKVETPEDIDRHPDFIYLPEPGTKIGPDPVPLLRENREGGITMSVGENGKEFVWKE